MYADPISVTIDTVATSFNKVGSPDPSKKGVYATSAGDKQIVISQNNSAQRFRREVRLNATKVSADPISSQNKEISTSIILTVDEPRWGFSDADLLVLIEALTDWVAVPENSGQLLNGEF